MDVVDVKISTKSLSRQHKYRKYTHWLVSNFIPIDSKKFGLLDFDYITRLEIKNESEIKKIEVT